ncbi:MAG: hypothetical protein VCA35_08485, partial [Roseibacillus sp.]
MVHLLAAPDFHNPVFLWKAGGAGAILLLGFILVAIINKLATRFVGPRLSTQGIMVLRKLIRYLGVAFVCIIALNQVG